jgi:aspartyl-tRNA(Asn)/glutamyl-tRNA(Gln) amidotransferase subunit C
MIKVSREEVLHIAALSSIELQEEEISPLIKNLEEILNYAARVQEVAVGAHEIVLKNSNVFRDDSVKRADPEEILHNAPKQEERYFVVPVVLE